MPELCSETSFWSDITRCTREPSCFVSMAVLLFIGSFLLAYWATMASASLICSGAFQRRAGAYLQRPVRVCPLGFSWLWWGRDEGPVQVFLSSWSSQRRAHRLEQCWCFCSLQQELLLRPHPLQQSKHVALHSRLQFANGETWKAAGPSCAIFKASGEPGSIFPSPNSCKYNRRWIVQAASVCLVLRNLS